MSCRSFAELLRTARWGMAARLPLNFPCGAVTARAAAHQAERDQLGRLGSNAWPPPIALRIPYCRKDGVGASRPLAFVA